MKTARFLGFAFAQGGLVGALLLLLDLAFAATVDQRWHALGSSAPLAWLAGLLGGGVAIAACAWLGRTRAQGAGDAEVATRVRERLLPAAFLTGAAGIALVQVNHRWLPDALEPASLATTAGILLGCALAWRTLGPGFGRLTRPLARGGPLVSALLALLALAVTASIRPTGHAEPWSPPELPPPAPASDAAATDRRQLLVVGIDGGGWASIDPLLEAGRLPHLRSLVERGRRGVLRSSADAYSPIIWNTIMTGQPPEVHGIDTEHAAVATNRNVKAIWNILEDRGWTVGVAHVPGTFPAEPLRGEMVAGYPVPQGIDWTYASSRSNLGWVVHHGGPRPDPEGPIPVALPEMPGSDRPVRVSLRHTPSKYFAASGTAPYLTLRRLQYARGADMEALDPLLVRLGVIPRHEIARFDLTLRSDGGSLRVAGSDGGRSLFELAPGEWSPWLAIDFGGERYVLRVRALVVARDELRLFVTSALREWPEGLTTPAELAPRLERDRGPYVVAGTGVHVFYEGSAVKALEEHIEDLAETRAAASLELMRSTRWDAFIRVFNNTDWAQHAFWQFREPRRYGIVGRARWGSDGAQHMDPEMAEGLAGAVDRSYELVDRWLGKMLREASEDALVLVLSDHALEGGPPNRFPPTRGIHQKDGIYLIAGPGVPAPADGGAALSVELDHVDVVPLILAHLGLPLALDLPGHVPPELFPVDPDGSPRRLPVAIATYEAGARHSGPKATVDDTVVELMRSLGYIE